MLNHAIGAHRERSQQKLAPHLVPSAPLDHQEITGIAKNALHASAASIKTRRVVQAASIVQKENTARKRGPQVPAIAMHAIREHPRLMTGRIVANVNLAHINHLVEKALA